jgi:hypothetical protein
MQVPRRAWPGTALRSLQLKHAAVAAVMAAAAFTRLWDLHRHSLYFDEAFSLLVARFPFGQMLKAQAGDPTPPFFHVLLRLFVLMGADGEAGRLLSALASLVGIAFLLSWGNILGKSPTLRSFGSAASAGFPGGCNRHSDGAWQVGALAACLAVLSGAQSEYALVVRAYTLAMALAAASTWFCVQAARTNRPAHWIGLTLCTIAGLYTHYYFAFVAIAQLCYLAIVCWSGKHLWKAAVISQLVAFAAFTRWLLVMASQFSQVQRGHWIRPASPVELVRLVKWFAVGDIRGREFPGFVAAATAFFAALALTGLVRAWKLREGKLLGLWACLPPVLALAGSRLQPMFVHKYLLVSAPAFCLLVSIGVVSLRSPWLRACCAALTLLFSAAGFWVTSVSQPSHRADIRSACAYVESHRAQDELAVHTTLFTFYPFLIYQRQPGWNRVLPSGRLPAKFGGGLVRRKDILDIKRQTPRSFWLVVFQEDPFTGRLLDGPAEARKVVGDRCGVISRKRYRWIDIFRFRCEAGPHADSLTIALGPTTGRQEKAVCAGK